MDEEFILPVQFQRLVESMPTYTVLLPAYGGPKPLMCHNLFIYSLYTVYGDDGICLYSTSIINSPCVVQNLFLQSKTVPETETLHDVHLLHSFIGSSLQSVQSRTLLQTLLISIHSPLRHLYLSGPLH